ncbi:MAG TPA: glycosyltransferase [Dehalococcoidia bacterium]|nr:glycosyltransferase [Dehalococcoidia bacterium]
MSEARPGSPLRIAVLGDFDGLHTRRWLEVFVARGHDLHAISFYPPREVLPGVTVHALSPVAAPSASLERADSRRRLRDLAPPSLMRFVHAQRYRRAGLRRVLDDIKPDVLHAHYVVEHGYYGSLAGFHPYVVSAWGSDLLVESHKPLGRLIARRALRSADFVTGNDASLLQRAIELGVPPERTAVVHLGTERRFLDAGADSVNLRDAASTLTVISDRALEPLYNIDVVLRAFPALRQSVPEARLVIAHDGSQRQILEALAVQLGLGDSVRFAGRLDAAALAVALAQAQVYVSVPSSDSFAVSTLEAMGAGAFPVLSDLPSAHGWVEDGVDALIVPPRNVDALAAALQRALSDDALRRSTAEANRSKVEAGGLRERTMLQMERIYYRLVEGA